MSHKPETTDLNYGMTAQTEAIALQPIPGWIKKGGIGLILLLALAVVGLTFNSPVGDQSSSMLDVELDSSVPVDADTLTGRAVKKVISVPRSHAGKPGTDYRRSS